MLRIEFKGCGFACLRRRIEYQITFGLKMKPSLHRVRQRIVGLVTLVAAMENFAVLSLVPIAGSHYENASRRPEGCFLAKLVFILLQPSIEPCPVDRVHVNVCIGTRTSFCSKLV